MTSNPHDRRAFDALLVVDDRRAAVEAIVRIVDAQGQVRPIVLKQEASGVERVVLVVADTRHNRSAIPIARPTLEPDFPCPGRTVMAALRAGQLPPANGIVLI